VYDQFATIIVRQDCRPTLPCMVHIHVMTCEVSYEIVVQICRVYSITRPVLATYSFAISVFPFIA
jgi:hypothetical protein